NQLSFPLFVLSLAPLRKQNFVSNSGTDGNASTSLPHAFLRRHILICNTFSPPDFKRFIFCVTDQMLNKFITFQADDTSVSYLFIELPMLYRRFQFLVILFNKFLSTLLFKITSV